MRSRPDAGHLSAFAHSLIIASLIVVALIAGREILEPLVIAALLAFILSPLIRRLRQWGVWRVPSVVLAVLFALGVIGALSAIIAVQVTQLAEDLPTYETNLRTKIRALGAGKLTSGALDRASGTLKDLQEEISKAGTAVTSGQKPMLVEVRQPEPRGLESIATLVRPLLSPLAMTALVVLFLIFILLQREDIRDRFLRLAGTADLQRSTAALDDAGSRLSRFFLDANATQCRLRDFHRRGALDHRRAQCRAMGNLCRLDAVRPVHRRPHRRILPNRPGCRRRSRLDHGACHRRPVPRCRADRGTRHRAALYGQHTGLSPVAIVISTLFWTLLWGPMGLLLATPLTVCLVVLGRHIEALAVHRGVARR